MHATQKYLVPHSIHTLLSPHIEVTDEIMGIFGFSYYGKNVINMLN